MSGEMAYTSDGRHEMLNSALEDAYWRAHYASRPYVKPGADYDVYRPAYRLGWEGRGRYGELNWSRAEPRLRDDWDRSPVKSALDWDDARHAARDAWERVAGRAEERR